MNENLVNMFFGLLVFRGDPEGYRSMDRAEKWMDKGIYENLRVRINIL
jgi:hypothetical protein